MQNIPLFRGIFFLWRRCAYQIHGKIMYTTMNYESCIQSNKPAVIDFSAGWCQPSKLMIPIFQELKKIVGDRATILNVDVEEEPALAELYKVQTIPTIMIFHKGQVLWKKNGISSSHEILEHLKTILD